MDSELQAALAWVDSGPVVVGAKHMNAVAEAAREWERLGLTRCDTCGGSGDLPAAPGLLSGGTITIDCSDCSGLGWLIPDTMIEAAVNGLLNRVGLRWLRRSPSRRLLMDSELQAALDTPLVDRTTREKLLIVAAASKWADHEDKTGACLRGITAKEDPDFEMEAVEMGGIPGVGGHGGS